MGLSVTTAAEVPVDLEVVLLAEDQPWPSTVRGSIRRTAETLGGEKVLGGTGEVRLLGGSPLRATVGVGPSGEVDLERLRRAAGQAVGLATDLRLRRLAI